MHYRKLGRTGIDVSVIGLGTEYMVKLEQNLVGSIVHKAVDSGINYFDVLFADAAYRDNFGAAFKGIRDKVLITGHLFTSESIATCRTSFHDHLRRLGTDYVDIVFVSCCDKQESYEQAMAPGGHLELARSFVDKGLARHIGFSSHTVPVARMAINSNAFDVLMFPINPAFDMLPGTTGVDDIGHLWQEAKRISLTGETAGMSSDRRELTHECAGLGIGLVAMKPFAAGWLFSPEAKLGYNPVKLLHYALSQTGVTAAVPGVANLAQLEADLAYVNASSEEKDYSAIIRQSTWNPNGNCMYCSHCQPCPNGIDIAEVMRLYDSARVKLTDDLIQRYQALANKPNQCAACKACEKRCPFQINTAARMKLASELFAV